MNARQIADCKSSQTTANCSKHLNKSKRIANECKLGKTATECIRVKCKQSKQLRFYSEQQKTEQWWPANVFYIKSRSSGKCVFNIGRESSRIESNLLFPRKKRHERHTLSSIFSLQNSLRLKKIFLVQTKPTMMVWFCIKAFDKQQMTLWSKIANDQDGEDENG